MEANSQITEKLKCVTGTCRVSSQQASGERHVSKKSFPDRNSRNSGDEIDEMTIQRDFNHNQLSSYEGKKKKTLVLHFQERTPAYQREKKRSIYHHTWQVSSGLSHTPHRDMLSFFSPCCSQECIIQELREVFRAGKRDKNLPLARVAALHSLNKSASNNVNRTEMVREIFVLLVSVCICVNMVVAQVTVS